jgi:hypothetical protein
MSANGRGQDLERDVAIQARAGGEAHGAHAALAEIR